MSKEQQTRGGFVHVGDLALDLPGVSVPARRERAPQARHHFTQLDQVTQLVGASESDADLGFMARLLALCSLSARSPLQYMNDNILYHALGNPPSAPHGPNPPLSPRKQRVSRIGPERSRARSGEAYPTRGGGGGLPASGEIPAQDFFLTKVARELAVRSNHNHFRVAALR